VCGLYCISYLWCDTDWLSTFSLAPIICTVTMILYLWTLVSLDTPELRYTWIPVLLNPWFSCDVTPLSCSCCLWLYNIIVDNLHRIGRNWWVLIYFHVYDGLKVPRNHNLGFYLEATRSFRGVYWCPYSPSPSLFPGVRQAPRPIPVGAGLPCSNSDVQ